MLTCFAEWQKKEFELRRSLSYITMSTLVLSMGLPVLAQSPTAGPADKGPQRSDKVVELGQTTIYGKPDDSGISGFRPRQATVGPFNRRSLWDTPISIGVMDQRFIENQQATSLTELLRFLPSAQMEARGGVDVGRPQTRGMQGDPVANSRVDGLNSVATTAQPMEMFERLEVINGLTSALYGPASPGGNFNFILKRPTDAFLNKVTLGYGGRSLWKLHADLGGRVGEDKRYGYRVNLVTEDGEGYVRHSDLERRLASGAFDLRLASSTVLELNASYYKFDKFGYPGGFAYGPTIELPDAPDPTRVGYGQGFSGSNLRTRSGSARLRHEFNADWSLTVGASKQFADRWFGQVSHTLLDSAGNYRSTVGSTAAGRFDVTSNLVNLNGIVATGAVRHELVLGSSGYDWDIYGARNASTSVVLGSANIANPVLYAEVPLPRSGGIYQSSGTKVQNVMAGDVMTFSETWSAMVVGSYNWIETGNFNLAGTRTAQYKDRGFSPTVALMFSPAPNLMTYVAYAQSLQAGSSAPTTAANAGESLAPYKSKQWEAGIKADLGQLDLNAALFEIRRPFAFTDPVTQVYRVQGNQVNRGLEMTVGGEVLRGLNLFGGLTFMDPKLRDTGNPATSDKQVVGAPKVQGNLLVEYFLSALPGLSVNANLHHTGKRQANNLNTVSVDGFTTLDLGARYETQLLGRQATLRLGIKNLTDERYWLSIFPGNIDGVVGASAGTAFMGAPREFSMSMSIDF